MNCEYAIHTEQNSLTIVITHPVHSMVMLPGRDEPEQEREDINVRAEKRETGKKDCGWKERKLEVMRNRERRSSW